MLLNEMYYLHKLHTRTSFAQLTDLLDNNTSSPPPPSLSGPLDQDVGHGP